jgi:hypothetical protein
MKAIIIEDKDCRALVDKLELAALQVDPTLILSGHPTEQMTAGDLHRRFHFHVVRWLQEQGWNSQ